LADGAGKGDDGWFKLTHSVVSYDHPHHALLEEAITIAFVNRALGPSARRSRAHPGSRQRAERRAHQGDCGGRNRGKSSVPSIVNGPRMIMTEASGTHPYALITAKTSGMTPARIEEASMNQLLSSP
jgi:hypothetical protein